MAYLSSCKDTGMFSSLGPYNVPGTTYFLRLILMQCLSIMPVLFLLSLFTGALHISEKAVGAVVAWTRIKDRVAHSSNSVSYQFAV